MTSSRDWHGAGALSSGRWKLEGRTHLARSERKKVYEEFGCEPSELSSSELPEGVEAAMHVQLPPEDSEEADRLHDRLDLYRPEVLDEWLRPKH
jgi:hypothetical protein